MWVLVTTHRLSLVVESKGLSLAAALLHELLIAVASLIA